MSEEEFCHCMLQYDIKYCVVAECHQVGTHHHKGNHHDMVDPRRECYWSCDDHNSECNVIEYAQGRMLARELLTWQVDGTEVLFVIPTDVDRSTYPEEELEGFTVRILQLPRPVEYAAGPKWLVITEISNPEEVKRIIEEAQGTFLGIRGISEMDGTTAYDVAGPEDLDTVLDRSIFEVYPSPDTNFMAGRFNVRL